MLLHHGYIGLLQHLHSSRIKISLTISSPPGHCSQVMNATACATASDSRRQLLQQALALWIIMTLPSDSLDLRRINNAYSGEYLSQ